MYVFTSDELLIALKHAKERGVKVRIILEKRVMSDDNIATFQALKTYGIDVKWASKLFTLTHAKFLIIDGTTVIIGSHNFSDNALTSNREASVLIERSAAVDEFKHIFEQDWNRE